MAMFTWKTLLEQEESKPYFLEMMRTLEKESNHFTIYPPKELRFQALKLTPFHKIKVVILGQASYHGPDEANGLAFSVPSDVKTPPSLRNIFKELENDVGLSSPASGNLAPWAEQGVLLLNTSLSVRHKEPGSHSQIGWQTFTDCIIQSISDHKNFVVFIFLGEAMHNQRRHLLIKKAQGDYVSTPFTTISISWVLWLSTFSKTNLALLDHNIKPIDWQL